MAPQNDEANLARIRDNQRRSRARRKEYQQELEQRVRAFEEQGIEASTEVQQAARRVAEENKRLRALLQHNGVSHASIEAFLRTGDFSTALATTMAQLGGAVTTDGGNVQVLEHLMVPRYPIQYGQTSALSAPGSVGPSSPVGEGFGGEGSSGHSREASVTTSRSSSMREQAATATASGAAGTNTSPTQSTKRSSGGSHHGHGHSHGGSSSRSGGHGHGSSSHGHRSSSDSKGKKAAAQQEYAGSGGDYLHPHQQGSYGMPTNFYGLDATSAEDLSQQYSAAEPAFFDYSVSPNYLGSASSAAGLGLAHTTATTSAGAAATATSYYGNVPGIIASDCPQCMSGMGCSLHGGFYEE